MGNKRKTYSCSKNAKVMKLAREAKRIARLNKLLSSGDLNADAPPTSATTDDAPSADVARTSSDPTSTSPITYEHSPWTHHDMLVVSQQTEPADEALVLVPAADPALAPGQDPLLIVKTEEEVAPEDGSNMSRRTKAAILARQRRANMTEEQRKAVKEKMAARQALSRARETSEQREMRLSLERKRVRSKNKVKRDKEAAARRKEVYDKLAARENEPKTKPKKKTTDGKEKKQVKGRRLADEAELLVPLTSRSVALDKPGSSKKANGKKSASYPTPQYDEYDQFGLMIADEIRNIGDLVERESVMCAIQNIMYESVRRRRQNIEESQHETDLVPKPIDDRTEEEIAVASIKMEPMESLDVQLPISYDDESHVTTQAPKLIDDPTEVVSVHIKTDRNELSCRTSPDSRPASSSQAKPDFVDATIPKPIQVQTVAAMDLDIKEEPVETYEITISDIDMSDRVQANATH